MDLIFGFSSSHVLLGILLAIDENKHRIPLSFILFSAQKDAKAVHADYNAELLNHLLEQFKFELGTNVKGKVFKIQVRNTDNDACKLIWCIFHIWQAWRNRLNRNLWCIPKEEVRNDIR